MKKTKKWLALLLAVMMLISLLAACGDSGYEEDDDDDDDDDEETSETTEETKDDEDGTKPDGNEDETQGDSQGNAQGGSNQDDDTQAPTQADPSYPTGQTEEVVIPNVPTEVASTAYGAASIDELDTLCVKVIDSYDDTIYVGIQNISDTQGLLYYRDSENYEYVLSVDGDNMYGYYKYADDSGFYADADASSIQSYYEYLTSCFMDLTDHSEPEEGFGYQANGDVIAQTGEAYANNVYYQGEYIGYIHIDKATGISVFEVSSDGSVVFQVLDIDTSTSWIPAI